MLLIPCPWCGERAETEFRCGGEAHIVRPRQPSALSDDAWAEYLFMRSNPKGAHVERWRHVHGCGRWFNLARDTVSDSDPGGLPDGRAAARGRQQSEAGRDLMSSHRLPRGGRIDRTRPIGFTFDGRRYQGFAGDTLASALLANGVRLVGRSFKYHRPRGIFSAGAEEPNALVQLGAGARTEPNVRATQVEIFDGLAARSQNCWPSVGFDLGEVEQPALAPLPGRVLLQDLHVAAVVLAPVRAADPARRRHGRSTARARSGPLRACARPLRRADRGRRAPRALPQRSPRVEAAHGCFWRTSRRSRADRCLSEPVDHAAHALARGDPRRASSPAGDQAPAPHDRVRLLRPQLSRAARAGERPSRPQGVAAPAAPADVEGARASGRARYRRARAAAGLRRQRLVQA